MLAVTIKPICVIGTTVLAGPRARLSASNMNAADKQQAAGSPKRQAFAFGLRLAHASQLGEKQLARIGADHFGMQLAGKHFHHHVAFVQAQ